MIVGSGSRGAGALDVAASVLSLTKGSLSNLAKLDAAQLEDVPGVGPVVAGRLIAAVELGRRVARAPRPRTEPVAGPGDVYRLLAPTLGDLDHEEFHVVLLNAQNIPITHKLVTRGILDASLIHPREVFRAAIVSAAAAIILVHNHPSGSPRPSAEDWSVTRRLATAGDGLGIPVLDHVIICADSFTSMAALGPLRRAGDVTDPWHLRDRVPLTRYGSREAA